MNYAAIPSIPFTKDTPKTVAFTGPRPKKLHGYGKDAYWPIVLRLEEAVRGLAEQGFARFLTGGAQGVDQLAFWAVNRARKDMPRLENIVYVPFPGQPDRWYPTGLFGRAEYRKMLSRATAVRVVGDDPPAGDMASVVEALNARNLAMVRNADLLLALTVDDAGGTAHCVRCAKAYGVPVLRMPYDPRRDPPFLPQRIE